MDIISPVMPREASHSEIRRRNRRFARAFVDEYADPAPTVFMIVRNTFEHDARVTREAEALADRGLRIVVFALAKEAKDIGAAWQGRLLVARVLPQTGPVRSLLFGLRGMQLVYWRAAKYFSGAVRYPARWLAGRGVEPARRIWDGRTSQAPRPPRGVRVLQWITRRVSLALRPLDRLWNNVSFCRLAASAAAGLSPVAVHCHDGNTILAGYLTKRRRPVKVIYDAHELWPHRNRPDPGRIKNWFTEVGDRALSRRADVVITVNRSIAEHMERRYRLAHVDVVMNTPKMHTPYSPLHTFDMPRPRLLYSGLLTYNRGLEEGIRALPKLPACHFVVMGPDRSNYSLRLQQLADELGVGDRLHIVPPVPHEQVPAAAAQADVALVLFRDICLSYRYALPNKLFEALHAGLAVVASDLPELRNVVTTWDLGALCDPDDPDSIAVAVRSVLDDPEGLERMRRNAKRASATFAWENEEPKLVEIYQRLGIIDNTAVPSARTIA